MNNRIRMILTAVIVTLGLLIPTASVAAPADEMGYDRAARHYLTNACDLTKAGEKFSWKVWLGRNRIPNVEVQRRLPEIKRLTAAYAKAAHKRADSLRNPPAPWPAEIKTPATRLGNIFVRYASTLDNASKARRAAGGPDSWSYWWRAALRVRFSNSTNSNVIRDYLGLPRSGGCGQV